MDGELVAWDDAKVHILTHSLHYGSGVFEGIRAYTTSQGPAVFRLTDHISRLFNSAKVYLIDIPYTVDDLVEAVKDTVRVNDLDACYIRPIVYLGYGEMGLNPLPCPVNVSIAVWPWGTYLGDEGHPRRRAHARSPAGSATTPTRCRWRPRGRACTATRRWPRWRPSRPATTRPSCCRPRAT